MILRTDSSRVFPYLVLELIYMTRDPADPYDTELNIMGCHASDLAPLNIRSMGTRAAWTDYMGELHFAPHSPTPLLTFPYHAQC